MIGARATPRLAFGTRVDPGSRMLPEEVAVALTFNGTTQAVMMATPDDLEDFAYGFALTEGIAKPNEILSVEIETLPRGRDIQIWLHPEAETRLAARRRTMTGPVGCGLCGIDSIDQALRDVPYVLPYTFQTSASQVMAAVSALPGQQRLHDATRAVHCAGFWAQGRIVASREDVGRHNALDKLVGAMVRAGTQPTGAVVLTSRVSIDMVQKVAMLGAPMIIAVSAPTADAVTLADHAGITLIALARPDRFEVFTHTDRLTEDSHVG
ncbi:MAG: formate dehydrogenase accessory sulfurtransferase FdhD [Tabrizicola sp.]|uniref:formate dehydrogenase accessory sulfurtransferase FdhD n=1 Tax=Tabrizicola sp. TaxID=2005166 RepID=UPI00273668F8|nr:formate dehydrogenase accessory sulfurtransferase FdhD [Tabrizicola sp.]MDP3262249.1 formate dehydrogenase accessory sulfurtransferase FdhD [Tabrizicola sp.]MDP3648004.1 formate dehydrogenase accessory sulfurtransferase FdhD [Paracoccaceae bacterium]MDZ4065429.1 formate dehydrogenase accessory sulfurtransferase FdhD [Tabrizicola sp.]